MDLQREYEDLFREIIDFLPPHEVNTCSAYMQALKYFFTYLCNQGISPESLTESDVENFFLQKYSTGTAPVTLTHYFGHIDRCYFRFKTSHLTFQPAQVKRWIERWEEEGVPTTLTGIKSGIEISYQSDIVDLLNTHLRFHPRN